MAGASEKADLVRAFYRSGFDPARLDEFVHPACVYHAPGGDVEGLEALREMCRELRAAFPDLRMSIEALRVDGPEVEVHWTMRGTHRGEIGGFEPTGRTVEMSGRHVEVVRGGSIVERFGTSDHEGLAEQLRGAGDAPDENRHDDRGHEDRQLEDRESDG